MEGLIMECKKILITEDEEPISNLLSYSLNKEGFITKTAQNGTECLKLLEEFSPDLIILDLMLPDMSGFDVCKEITRKHVIPIVIITAKSDSVDKILGMELGADDYITKPFNTREVIVRIKAIFRRINLTAEAREAQETKILQISDKLYINVDGREVYKDNKKLDFTNKEFDLLLYLAENKRIVVSRSKLLDKVWGFEFAGDTRTVDIHVQRIRKKLDQDKNSSIIETVFGVGYKLI
jgi:DNA-binding response OmpR family regulator